MKNFTEMTINVENNLRFIELPGVTLNVNLNNQSKDIGRIFLNNCIVGKDNCNIVDEETQEIVSDPNNTEIQEILLQKAHWSLNTYLQQTFNVRLYENGNWKFIPKI